MTRFKELGLAHHEVLLTSPFVTASLNSSNLTLKFDSKDVLIAAAYSGPVDVWLSSLCELIPGKHLSDLLKLSLTDWENSFSQDQLFWDLKAEVEESCFFKPLEMLRAALNLYRGRDYLYTDPDPLVCRCLGVREKDIVNYLNSTEAPSLEGVTLATKAGMGCRSCLPQLKRWLASEEKGKKHFYKERSIADWLLEIDLALQDFPQTLEWKIEVESFKGNQVILTFDKEVSQHEEEKLAAKLQGFLASVVDPGLGFFLRRSRQR